MKETAIKGGKVSELIKALVLSVIITLALILIAALVIKIFNVPGEYIPIINQIIKSVAILAGALAFLREKGGIVGKIAEIHNVSDKEKEFVLSTGIEGNKSLLTFDFNAIYQVMSKAAPVASKKEAAAEAAPAETTEAAPAETATDDNAENK